MFHRERGVHAERERARASTTGSGRVCACSPTHASLRVSGAPGSPEVSPWPSPLAHPSPRGPPCDWALITPLSGSEASGRRVNEGGREGERILAPTILPPCRQENPPMERRKHAREGGGTNKGGKRNGTNHLIFGSLSSSLLSPALALSRRPSLSLPLSVFLSLSLFISAALFCISLSIQPDTMSGRLFDVQS